MFAASTPPLSSPYFLITPKMNAETRWRCCAASTRRITRSTGFMRTVLPSKAGPKQADTAIDLRQQRSRTIDRSWAWAGRPGWA